MLVACWSVKGGSGTTVVAAALGMVLASSSDNGALLVDLDGDLPAALGIGEPALPGSLGLADWLAAGPEVLPEALGRLEMDAGPGLRLLPRGGGQLVDDGAERLAGALSGPRPAVVDCGSRLTPLGLGLAACASLTLLVLRPCYLALRRALVAPIRPSGVVLVRESGRALGPRDVEAVLGVPVRAEVAWDPSVARAVDAGLLGGRLPRSLDRALRRAA